MTNPSIWYTLNAQLDGVDTEDYSAHGLMLRMTHQRRMVMDAQKTLAHLQALIGGLSPEAASSVQKVADKYFKMIVPPDPNAEADRLRRNDNELAKLTVEMAAGKTLRPTDKLSPTAQALLGL